LKVEPDIKQFTALVEKHQGIIFKVSRMYCENADCRKDLFQDILFQLWKSYDSYKPEYKFSSWMYRVALNTAISQFRKGRNRNLDFVGELPENLIADELLKEKEERAIILHKAINQLNKGEKAIIILYMDDYTYEEISEIIGISNSNVGVKINRIKTKLQTILKELGYGL